ncbi:MAG TPA: Hsp70 family protein [Bryobacteraceae bacterium]|nr:Hsp70 family protein [Bryobacteraceae bacterium]
MRAVGIDFGTTNCAVAIARDGMVETARFGAASLETFRSVLYFDGAQSKGRKRPLAGPSAIDAYLVRETPGRLIQSLKSFLSSSLFRETWVASERYSVEDLTTAMALSLREEAEKQFGDLGKRLVLGRPVRFVGADTKEADALAVARLEEAFHRAGFDQIIFEYEPVGAAYHYESTLDHDERIVIADFGGGTSDFSLLKVGPKRRRRGIVATAGLPLAGDSFDAKIVRHVVSPMLGLGSMYRSLDKTLPMPSSVYLKLEKWHHLSFLKTQETLRMLRSLEAQAEEPSKIEALIQLVENDAGYNLHRAVQRTKVELSTRQQSEFVYEDPSACIRKVVTRGDFEDWIEPQLSQISDCVDGLLQEARTQAAQVDRVFLTGGTSLVPAVRRIFENRFGEEKLQAGDEFTSVARGLALRAQRGKNTG